MTNKELFIEIADRYLPICAICKDKNFAVKEIFLNSKIAMPISVLCCNDHILEAALSLTKKVSDVSLIKIQSIVVDDLYKTILFFDQIDNISKDALNDLLQFVPLCDECEVNSAIYKAHIPCALDSECHLCKSCGIAYAKRKDNQYKIEDLEKQEAILQLEELVCS